MRTSERTLDTLRNYRVPSPSEMDAIVLDLSDLADMEDRSDGPCYYCGEPTQRHAGNPAKWPLKFPHADEPGKAKPHHVLCVVERLNKLAAMEGGRGRCPDCHGELSACGDMTADGSRDDCLVCRLRERLAAMEKERDELRDELAEWKAAFKVDDREGDSRLMARAMGQALDAAVLERDRLVEALTPSGDTKAAYHGEFSWEVPCRDGEGVDTQVVPWTTVKEIMQAISNRAASTTR